LAVDSWPGFYTRSRLLADKLQLRQLEAMSADEAPADETPAGETASKSMAPAESEKRASAERPLTPAAQRALAEAAARRAERDRHPADHPEEVAGRGGPEPTRYGDWEINGLISDF
jgi:hypothetical protein